MKQKTLTVFLIALFAIIIASSEEFDYDHQGSDWTGECASGRAQSPIAISPANTVCDESQLFNLYFTPGSQTFTVVDTGESLKATTTSSTLYATATTGLFTGYEALQFHFHAPSEHTINEKHMDLEMHFVHSITSDFSSRGETTQTLAVVGIFFEVDERAEVNPFIEAMNFANIDTTGVPRSIDLNEILLKQIPTPIQYYTYQGSLTTPPCAESVNWYVISTPLKIKKSQLKAITDRYAENEDFADGNGNNRKVVPLNGRVVKRGGMDECIVIAEEAKGVTVSDAGMAGIVIGCLFLGAALAAFAFFFLRLAQSKKIISNGIPNKISVVVKE